MPLPLLTKSQFMNGSQCSKRLWNEVHNPAIVPAASADDLDRFAQGHALTAWARTVYSNGVLIDAKGREEALAQTRDVLARRVPVFEGAFLSDFGYARADILLPAADAWDLVEVKMGAHIKEYYYHDLAFQKAVLERAGIVIGKCFTMTVNSSYVRNGAIDASQLFTMTDVTERVSAITDIDARAHGLREMLTGSEPNVKIGVHCTAPHECPLKKHCWSFLPPHSVAELYYSGKEKFSYIESGALAITDVTDELTWKQTIQRRAIETNSVQVDAERLRKHLADLTYPLAYLDFETAQPAIPLYDGTSPFENVPFQFSLHIEQEDGSIEHYEYLHEGTDDPRPVLLHELHRALPATGTIIAHNAGFEKRCLERCALAHPEHSEWITHAVKRMWDSIKPFQDFAYYHPDQHGSCSIKAILPALNGDSYKDLVVGDGGTASREWLRITFEDCPVEEKNALREHLLRYCKLDTQAMVAIVRILQQAC